MNNIFTNKLTKARNFIKSFICKNKDDLKNILLDYFQDKKIYCEIFKGNIDLSQSFSSKLQEYRANIYKHLSKNLDYIVFQEGHLRTKKFASLNNINLVNPFWIDDKISKGIFDDDNKYLVPVNYIEFIIDNNLNSKNKSNNSVIKNTDTKIEDDFDLKLNNYIETKMKSIKSDKGKKINNELYYPLFDENKRVKRRSDDYNYPNKILINPTNFNENIYFNNNPKKINIIPQKSKLTRNKSETNLNKQTKIEITNNKLTLVINNYDKEKKSKSPESQNMVNKECFSENNKINVFTYYCNQEQINILNDFEFFQFKNQINDLTNDFNKNNDLLLTDFEKNKYNYKIYQCIFDKILIVDINQFLIEFINEKYSNSLELNKNKILKKLNNILLYNNFTLLNSRIDTNKDSIDLNKNYFIICKNLLEEEYKILKTILKKYLKADIYNDINEIKKKLKKNNSQQNIFTPKIIQDCIDLKKSKNENSIYLIAKRRENFLYCFEDNTQNISFIKTSYLFDSFIKGNLINLSDKENLELYKL